MGESGDRLKRAREKAGFKSARAAAIFHGWKESTYASHENGQTDPVPSDAAKIYGYAFDVKASWIVMGDEPDERSAVIGLHRTLAKQIDEEAAAVDAIFGFEPPDIRKIDARLQEIDEEKTRLQKQFDEDMARLQAESDELAVARRVFVRLFEKPE
jgi:transcriptional regulator with XRE-family HTH domain